MIKAYERPQGDLISREALIKESHNFFDGKIIDEPSYILRDVFCYIDNAPTIKTFTLTDIEEQYRKGLEKGLSEWETERPQGEWIKHSTYKDVLICPKCNHGSNQVYDTFNFCPNCGASMMKGGAE